MPLAVFWFLLLGGLGIFFPFYSLYLRENLGLSGSQVGAVLATLPLMGLAAQPFWGQVADRTGSRSRLLTFLTLCAGVGYAALGFADGFLQILVATALAAVFSTATIPMCVSVSLAALRSAGPHAFGLVRVWGTVGFLVCVVGFPALLHRVQASRGWVARTEGVSEPGLELMFAATGALLLVAGLVSLALPRRGAVALRAGRGDWRELLRRGAFVRLLVFALGAYFCLQGPMTHFPIFVRARGGDLSAVSTMWIFMLLFEIPLIALSGVTLMRFGPRWLVAMGVISGGLRWVVSGLVEHSLVFYAVQVLHGFSVAGLVIGGPLYVDAVVPERLRSTGQGLLAMLGVSIGGIASNLSTGWLIEHVSVDAPYVAGGLGALVLGCLVPLLLPRPAPPSRRE